MQNSFKKKQERFDFFHQVQNRIKKSKEPIEIPDNVIKSCNHCNASMPCQELMEDLYVCPRCGQHMNISARERIRELVDERSFKELDRNVTTIDLHKFPDYEVKLEKYRRATGLQEAIIYGTARIYHTKLVIAVMDANFMMASMGYVVGDKITRAIEFATKKKLPLLICCASGGARMQEGMISLMQMAKTSAALKRYHKIGKLYISLLTNPTTGGVSASFAMLGDIIIAEPDALIGFAGKRVIEKTINEVLPVEFQRANFVLEKGFIDMVVERKKLKQTIAHLLEMHGG